MVAFRSTDTSGRTTGLLFRCVLYSLLALALIIVDKRYDHLGKIRRLFSVAAYPVQVAVASPFQGWNWFRDSVTTRDVLRADKTKLEAELRVAQFRLQRYEALEAETQRLRALRDNTAGVIVGDLLVTSGLGGGFPAGYPVGTIAEVKRDPAQSLADVDVKPAAALDRSRELMFVWLKPQASSPAPAASATSGASVAPSGHPAPAPAQPQPQSAAAIPVKTPPPDKTPPPAGANDE